MSDHPSLQNTTLALAIAPQAPHPAIAFPLLACEGRLPSHAHSPQTNIAGYMNDYHSITLTLFEQQDTSDEIPHINYQNH
jgi:hypothetical protein